MYYDLFARISKGSILLWNVEDEKELPKRKELIRLLGTEDFTYYKTNGHHRDYIRTLARLKDSLTSKQKKSVAAIGHKLQPLISCSLRKRLKSTHFSSQVLNPMSGFVLRQY